MFIVKNYFERLPESVEESARIDGAGELRTLVSIVCPMSKPVIATVGLLYAINYWNNYFHAMMYTQMCIRDSSPLGVKSIRLSPSATISNILSSSKFLAEFHLFPIGA